MKFNHIRDGLLAPNSALSGIIAFPRFITSPKDYGDSKSINEFPQEPRQANCLT
jgi:hypothetical protein